MSVSQQTQYSLIQRAFDLGDQDAWEQFVAHYKRFIYYILHRMGVDPDEIDDVSQKILAALTSNLSTYDRSKSRFRTWLSSVIRNIAISHIRHEQGYRKRIENFEKDPLLYASDKPEEIERLIEKEWATYVASQAMMRVRKVFQGQAIEAFELAMEGLSAHEIAEKTGLTVSSVYTLRKRVKKRLYLEILELTSDLER